MKSIQHELMAWILGGTLVLIVATGVLMSTVVHWRLLADFDAALENKARVLATLVLREGKTVEVDFAGEFMPEFGRNESPEYFQFRFQDGTTIERSDRLESQDLPFVPAPPEAVVFRDFRLPDGRSGRFVQISFPPREGAVQEPPPGEIRPVIPDSVESGKTLVVLGLASNREELNQRLFSMYLAIGGMDALLLLSIGMLSRWSIRRGFRPIHTLDAQIGRYQPSELDFRIDLPHAPTEIQSIPETVNRLLDRGETVLARERRFSSDVAHELRTPIAELRAACEVGAKWPEDKEMVRQLNADTLDATLHLEQIVVNLMELARCDGDRATFKPTAVPVPPLVEACRARLDPEIQKRKLHLDNRIAAGLTLNTDREKFDMIVRNIVDNAVAYSPPGGEIVCESLADGTTTVLRFRNPTASLRPEDVPHIFERFWRKKHLAHEEDHHSGLGLSIVQSFAETLGMGVDVALSPENTFEIRLSIPAEIIL